MKNLDALLNQYEDGSLSRRDLLAALALLVAAPAAADAAQAAKPVGAVKSMNHVTVFVPNVQKAVDFYQGLFGMPILTKQDAGINLSTGTGLLRHLSRAGQRDHRIDQSRLFRHGEF